MSRRGGCPFNIRDYSVSIKNQVTDGFVRVKGLNGMRVEVGADTEDGRTGEGVWAEMFIRGRSVSGSIEGRPIADRATGARDPGQALMRSAAFSEGGCANDQTLRIADAVGRAVEYDCVVTREIVEADEDGETVSWEWEGVGRPRDIAYVQAAGVSFTQDGAAVASIGIPVGGTAVVRVAFAPSDASNQRFSYCVEDPGVAAVSAVDDAEITLRGVGAGATALIVRTMNNALTARLAIGVTA